MNSPRAVPAVTPKLPVVYGLQPAGAPLYTLWSHAVSRVAWAEGGLQQRGHSTQAWPLLWEGVLPRAGLRWLWARL